MTITSYVRTAARCAAGAAAFATVGYAAYAGATWCRFGRPAPPRPDELDEMLDRFMPVFDVVERHRIAVRAPAAVTLAAARETDIGSRPAVRAIFRGRELILGSTPAERRRPRGLVDEVLSLGWVILAESPGREMVFGAVTRPWQADVTFRSIAPEAFAAFAEPDYVKIAWTLRADPTDAAGSTFRTETRAVATDPAAAARFRWYWSCLSPGIVLIRQMLLRPVKAEAERRAASWIS